MRLVSFYSIQNSKKKREGTEASLPPVDKKKNGLFVFKFLSFTKKKTAKHLAALPPHLLLPPVPHRRRRPVPLGRLELSVAHPGVRRRLADPDDLRGHRQIPSVSAPCAVGSVVVGGGEIDRRDPREALRPPQGVRGDRCRGRRARGGEGERGEGRVGLRRGGEDSPRLGRR